MSNEKTFIALNGHTTRKDYETLGNQLLKHIKHRSNAAKSTLQTAEEILRELNSQKSKVAPMDKHWNNFTRIYSFPKIINRFKVDGFHISYAHTDSSQLLSTAYHKGGVGQLNRAIEWLITEHINNFRDPYFCYSNLIGKYEEHISPKKSIITNEEQAQKLEARIDDLPESSFARRVLSERLTQYQTPNYRSM